MMPKQILRQNHLFKERLTKSINNGNFKAYHEVNEQVLDADVFVIIIPILNNEQGEQKFENTIRFI